MKTPSDHAQKAAIDAAIRAIETGDRPRAAEREVVIAHLKFVKARIVKAEEAAAKKERGA